MCRIQFRIDRDRHRQRKEMQARGEETPSQHRGEDNDTEVLYKPPEDDEVALLSPKCKKYSNAQHIESSSGFYSGYLNQVVFVDFGTQLSTFLRNRQAMLDPATATIIPLNDIKVSISVQ